MKGLVALVVLVVAWPLVKAITWLDEAALQYRRLEDEFRRDHQD